MHQSRELAGLRPAKAGNLLSEELLQAGKKK